MSSKNLPHLLHDATLIAGLDESDANQLHVLEGTCDQVSLATAALNLARLTRLHLDGEPPATSPLQADETTSSQLLPENNTQNVEIEQVSGLDVAQNAWKKELDNEFVDGFLEDMAPVLDSASRHFWRKLEANSMSAGVEVEVGVVVQAEAAAGRLVYEDSHDAGIGHGESETLEDASLDKSHGQDDGWETESYGDTDESNDEDEGSKSAGPRGLPSPPTTFELYQSAPTSSWFFDIHEDTAGEENAILRDHYSRLLDTEDATECPEVNQENIRPMDEVPEF